MLSSDDSMRHAMNDLGSRALQRYHFAYAGDS
jgi:hypothetical protein